VHANKTSVTGNSVFASYRRGTHGASSSQHYVNVILYFSEWDENNTEHGIVGAL
jgi:hypothetical protein